RSHSVISLTRCAQVQSGNSVSVVSLVALASARTRNREFGYGSCLHWSSCMCSARNFHPEWGYFAPAPSFVRIVQIVLVATAVGAAAGASVVFSLVGRPATETSEIPVAARTLAWPVRDASAPLSAPQAAQVSA